MRFCLAIIVRPICLLLLPLLLFEIPCCRAGCFQKSLCCSGRNNTCKSIDDGILHLPTVSTMHNEEAQTFHQRNQFEREYYSPHYDSSGDGYDFIFPEVFEDESNEKIGKLILPDIIEMEGSGADRIYSKYGIGEQPPPPSTTTTTSTPPLLRIQQFIFGKKLEQTEPVEEITRYSSEKPRHLLIRYSMLSKHIPLKVATSPQTSEDSQFESLAHNPNLYYLESAEPECFCDEHCVTLGDCCSDYTFVCPPRDCVVSDWNQWSSCKPDKGVCGIGTQERRRSVDEPAERGGAPCPPLKEMKTCFVECAKVKPKPKSQLNDVTTVALIIDYKYNKTRTKTSRNNIYWDLPKVVEKLKKTTYYCVHYTIDWVNRNCVSRLLSKGLVEGSTLCAECQPQAQLHRNNARCASDLDDGDEGFWKLIGPKSCNGIWTRLNRTDNCQCQIDYPASHPFLLV